MLKQGLPDLTRQELCVSAMDLWRMSGQSRVKPQHPPPFPHPHLGLMKPAARWMHTRQPVCDYTPMPTAPLGWARGGGRGGRGKQTGYRGDQTGVPKAIQRSSIIVPAILHYQIDPGKESPAHTLCEQPDWLCATPLRSIAEHCIAGAIPQSFYR